MNRKKAESVPRFAGRDMVLIRARNTMLAAAVVLLAAVVMFATPVGAETWEDAVDDSTFVPENITVSGDTFTIYSAYGLAWMAKDINTNPANRSKTFELNDDIDIFGRDWVPIGNSISKFQGTFDGDGHTISNLYIYNPFADFMGLFNATDSSAIVKNVNLTNVNITGRGMSSDLAGVGSLVGINFGSISNSYANGSITGEARLGGFVGVNAGTIKNSSANVSVKGSGDYVGGFTGYNEGSIMNSSAVGDVTGSNSVGGLGGRNNMGQITNCYAAGTVTGSGYEVGGLAGRADLAYITNCYAAGNVTGDNAVGGLVGVGYACSITNSIALNEYVNGGSYVGRVAGGGPSSSAVGANCHAWKGMINNLGSFAHTAGNGIDATSEQVWANLTFYQPVFGSANISEDGNKVWNVSTAGIGETGWTLPYLTAHGAPYTDFSTVAYLKPKLPVFTAISCDSTNTTAANLTITADTVSGWIYNLNYTKDNWATNTTTALREISDGIYTANISGLPASLTDVSCLAVPFAVKGDVQIHGATGSFTIHGQNATTAEIQNTTGIVTAITLELEESTELKAANFVDQDGNPMSSAFGPAHYVWSAENLTIIKNPATGNATITAVRGGGTTLYLNVSHPADEGRMNVNVASISVTVTKKTPTADNFTFTGPAELTYDGSAKSVTVSVKPEISGMGHIEEISYHNASTGILQDPIAAGSYKVNISVTEGANYTAASDITADAWTFTILPRVFDSGNVSVNLAQDSFTYNGTAITPSVSVVNASGTILPENDYELSGSRTETAANTTGTPYTITATGKGNYTTGTIPVFWNISRAVLHADNFTITPSSATYTGSPIPITVALNAPLSEAAGMTNYFDGNLTFPQEIGTHTVNVTLTGGTNFTDVDNLTVGTVTITPHPPAPSSGGGEDTSSGHYTEYPRSVSNGGYVNFGTSPIITGVTLPEGTSGSVVLKTVTSEKGPAGKTISAVVELTAPETSGTSEITFRLTLTEIAAAGYTTNDVVLYNKEGDIWKALKTKLVSNDGKTANYAAETTAFGPFAVVYDENGTIVDAVIIPTAEATPAPVETSPAVPTSSATSVPSAQPTKTPAPLFAVIAGMGTAALLIGRKLY